MTRRRAEWKFYLKCIRNFALFEAMSTRLPITSASHTGWLHQHSNTDYEFVPVTGTSFPVDGGQHSHQQMDVS